MREKERKKESERERETLYAKEKEKKVIILAVQLSDGARLIPRVLLRHRSGLGLLSGRGRGFS